MSQLGEIADSQGQYRPRESYDGALKIREATPGPDDLDVAESLGNLAAILLVRGDYVRPEPLYQQALTIYERASASGQTSAPSADLEKRPSPMCSTIGRSSITREETTLRRNRSICRLWRSESALSDRTIRPSPGRLPTLAGCITPLGNTRRQ